MHFVSRRARVKGFFEGESFVLGPSVIGNKSLIGLNVIIGYPVRNKVQAFKLSKGFTVKGFDGISTGARIGRGCLIRSGSVIYEEVSIGNWVETGHNVLIREGSIVGDRTRIGTSAKLDGAVKVGKNVSIQSNVYLPHLTTVEDDVFLAPNVVFTNDPYPPSQRRAGTTVERGAIVGANACIVAPAKIGAKAVVGAGALVTRDVPKGMVVLGAPAKPYITRDLYDQKMTKWEGGVE